MKTDRVDVEAMVFTLKAYLLGDRSVCRPVRLPSVAEEDAKRLSRERTQFKKERTRHVNRIRALLVLHGIRSIPGLWGGRWKEALSNIRTGDGRELRRFIFRELCRQLERLDLVHSQLKTDRDRAHDNLGATNRFRRSFRTGGSTITAANSTA